MLRHSRARGPPGSGARRQRDAIAAAAQLKFADVPELSEIIALPQDEMRDVVARFTGSAAGGRGGGGRGAGGGMVRLQTRPSTTGWRRSNGLDFDKLSRNAQVDYLFIRRTAETQIART